MASTDQTNQHGLSRAIPAALKLAVRQACGFGCVKCGNAVYQYEHFDPPFEDAKSHDPDGIALLCAGCHDPKTRGFYSAEAIAKARRDPFCLKNGSAGSKFRLEVGTEEQFRVRIGRTVFAGVETIIKIDDQNILAIRPPQAPGEPPRISAHLFDRKGNQAASIEDNEWLGSAKTFDIETVGGRFKLRSGPRQLDLVLRVEPPYGVAIEKIKLHYRGKTVSGDEKSGFTFRTHGAAVVMPKAQRLVRDAPFGFHLTDGGVAMGDDAVLTYSDATSGPRPVPGSIEAIGSTVEQSEDGVMKITASKTHGVHGIRINFDPTPKRNLGRNDPCYCGSGKKFKKCHGR